MYLFSLYKYLSILITKYSDQYYSLQCNLFVVDDGLGWSVSSLFQMDDSAEALQKDASCHKSREHLNTSLRTLELVQPSEIETLMETIISVSPPANWKSWMLQFIVKCLFLVKTTFQTQGIISSPVLSSGNNSSCCRNLMGRRRKCWKMKWKRKLRTATQLLARRRR